MNKNNYLFQINKHPHLFVYNTENFVSLSQKLLLGMVNYLWNFLQQAFDKKYFNFTGKTFYSLFYMNMVLLTAKL